LLQSPPAENRKIRRRRVLLGGAGELYTIFKLDDGDAAAAYTMRPEERSMVPPHWNLYISVDSADDTAMRASEFGGKIIAAPFDVMRFGRMVVIQDPTGAVFSGNPEAIPARR
jgi:predicted enzyme related to lactoylglutathione lyase